MQVVSATPPTIQPDTTLPKVDTDKIARREARAVEVGFCGAPIGTDVLSQLCHSICIIWTCVHSMLEQPVPRIWVPS